MKKKIPATGDVFMLSNDRLAVVGGSVTLDGLTLYTIFPVSFAIFLASERDFLIIDEPVFKKETVMLEIWNSLAIPVEFFKSYKIKGRLEDKYVRYLSSYIYFSLQNRKNRDLSLLTGPPLTSSSDIRWLFRQMEIKEFHELRTLLITITG